MKNQNKTCRRASLSIRGLQTGRRAVSSSEPLRLFSQSICDSHVQHTCRAGSNCPRTLLLTWTEDGWGAPQLGKWPSPSSPTAEGKGRVCHYPLSPASQIPCCFVVPEASLHTAIPLISLPINFSQARHEQKMLCIQA